MAEDYVVHDFALVNEESVDKFTTALESNDIDYSMKQVEVIQYVADASDILDLNMDQDDAIMVDPSQYQVPVVSDADFEQINVEKMKHYYTATLILRWALWKLKTQEL